MNIKEESKIKINSDSKEYKDLISALDIINNKIIDITAKVANAKTLEEENILGDILKGLLNDRENICDQNMEIIKTTLEHKA